MTVNDLRGLKVQLNQELMIKRLYPDQKGTADPRFRSLKMLDNEYYEFIRFKTSFIGRIERIGEQQFDDPIEKLKSKMRVLLGQSKRQVLEVCFEEGGSLIFISTDSGGFEVLTEPGGKKLKYQDNKYQCVYGCAGNSLVVDGDYFYDFYMNFKNPDGSIFKEYHPEHWR